MEVLTKDGPTGSKKDSAKIVVISTPGNPEENVLAKGIAESFLKGFIAIVPRPPKNLNGQWVWDDQKQVLASFIEKPILRIKSAISSFPSYDDLMDDIKAQSRRAKWEMSTSLGSMGVAVWAAFNLSDKIDKDNILQSALTTHLPDAAVILACVASSVLLFRRAQAALGEAALDEGVIGPNKEMISMSDIWSQKIRGLIQNPRPVVYPNGIANNGVEDAEIPTLDMNGEPIEYFRNPTEVF